MIHGSRVKQARELRGIKSGSLADSLGISPGRLTQIERDGVIAGAITPELLSAHLLMPPAFFSTPIPEELSDGSMRFRARKTTKADLALVRRRAEVAHELAHHLVRFVNPPASRVPALPAGDIEEAAQQTRAALSIAPDAVIPNVVHALERAGVFVYAVEPIESGKIDAFTTWTGPALERPIMAIAATGSWDRLRLTAAHELGHLVMHRASAHLPELANDVEGEADRFAGAFLMPRDAALEEIPRGFTLNQLFPLKERWGMSLGALVWRAFEVGVIDLERRRGLHQQIGVRGWRTREPGWDARPPERPRALRKMFELAYGPQFDIARVAGMMHRYATDLQRDLARYAGAPSRTRPSRATTTMPATDEPREMPNNVVQLRRR
ncbi:XRE family transcriptional regulator [Geodermatophilus sp. FMUSA9-8]|uniref:XRE family transcriptional regulator n=1 Tax=Geodermatophilus sp. FMUSA9-8 TaxID=3120155 RepID=UPI00300A8610